MVTAETITGQQVQEVWQAAMRMQSDEGDRLAADCEDASCGYETPARVAAAKARIAAAWNARHPEET